MHFPLSASCFLCTYKPFNLFLLLTHSFGAFAFLTSLSLYSVQFLFSIILYLQGFCFFSSIRALEDLWWSYIALSQVRMERAVPGMSREELSQVYITNYQISLGREKDVTDSTPRVHLCPRCARGEMTSASQVRREATSEIRGGIIPEQKDKILSGTL